LSDAFFLDSKLSQGEIRPLPSWFDTKSTKPKALGGFGVQSRHAAHHCRLSFHFLRCVAHLILKFSFSDVPDPTWNTWNNFNLEPKYMHSNAPSTQALA
jgi:hypothetical protein